MRTDGKKIMITMVPFVKMHILLAYKDSPFFTGLVTLDEDFINVHDEIKRRGDQLTH